MEGDPKIVSLSLLECPICKEMCVPPLIQCQHGHLICKTCRYKVKECGVCRVPLGTGTDHIRCLALEKLFEDTVLPCKFEDKGCPLKMKIGLLQSHGLDCPSGKSALCLYLPKEFSQCQVEIEHDPGTILKHMTEGHGCTVVPTAALLKFTIRQDVVNVFPAMCVAFDGKVFMLFIKIGKANKDMSAFVLLMGSTNCGRNYEAQLTLHEVSPDSTEVPNSLRWTGPVAGLDVSPDGPGVCTTYLAFSNQLLRAYFHIDEANHQVSWNLSIGIRKVDLSQESIPQLPPPVVEVATIKSS